MPTLYFVGIQVNVKKNDGVNQFLFINLENLETKFLWIQMLKNRAIVLMYSLILTHAL